jgi:carboxypeptidase Q
MSNPRFTRILAPIAAVLVLCLATGAQVAQEKVDLDAVAKIKAEGLERSQVMEILSYLTDVHGPRLTGSPQMKAANEWTKNKMAEWGLQNARLEAWGPFGRGWSLDRFSANVIEPTPFPLIAHPKAWTPGTNGTVVGEVILPEINSEADFEKYRGKLKNAFVLTAPMREVRAQFTPSGRRLTDEQLLAMSNADPAGAGQPGGRRPQGGPANPQAAREFNEKKTAFFRSEGVAALLDPGRGDGGTVFVGGGGPRDKNAPQALPSVVVAIEHYGRITRLLQKGIKVKLEMSIAARFHDDDLMAYNTIAEIPGTDKQDEIVMVGAHLDSWHGGTGATDNAAGCAVAMEAVRILKAAGLQPRRTIRVGLWSGEEQGLLGSRAYVSEHFASRPAPPPGQELPPGGGGRGQGAAGPLNLKPAYDKFSVYFNLDNGTGKIRGVYLQGNEAVRPIFRAWLAPFRDLGASTLTISNTGGTDHLSFDGVGLPGFQFIQDPVEYDSRTHHSNMDVYERLQADDMKQASVIMAAFLYHAAMRDEKLPRKPLPRPQSPASGQPR